MQWQSSGVTFAVATGGLYAVIQRAYYGDSNYLVNIGLAGANKFAVKKWWEYCHSLGSWTGSWTPKS
jgi:hypothetical protein